TQKRFYSELAEAVPAEREPILLEERGQCSIAHFISSTSFATLYKFFSRKKYSLLIILSNYLAYL
ncbi:hypothetical protein, partial [Aquibacillus rhizosphaerae]